ncbi:MAG: dynamin family protein [Terriglobales bacterium]
MRLAELAESFGAERLVADARALAERIAEGRFFVACVGQFKRGKSTLQNALVDADILPTGIVPVTTVPTVVRYGDRPSARVQTGSGSWAPITLTDVQQYVSEEYNPENAKGVTGVEVFVPSPLLASGMCFVDTPGLGSVFAGNTAATQEFIPHIDAAIVVIGADPPISGEELAIVESVAAQVRDLVFVLNKADRVTAKEKAESVAFARRMIESRLHRPIGVIYEISASEWLEKRGPERDRTRFLTDLQNLAEHSGRSLTRSAKHRGLRRITDQLLSIIHEERQALVRPVEESERRVAMMGSTIADAERSMMELTYLFIAEQHRLSRTFADRREQFLKQTRAEAHNQLAAAIAKIQVRSGPAFRRAAMHAAQDIARDQVSPWLFGEEAYAEEAYAGVAQRFVNIGNDFLRRLSEAGLPELAEMPRPLDAEQGFRTRSQFFFKEFVTVAEPAAPFRLLADLVMGVVGARVPIIKDAHEFLDKLLYTNSARVQSDVDRRIDDGKSRLEAEIRVLLHEVKAVAERALKHARAAQAAGASAVAEALARLEAAESEIRRLRPADSDVVASAQEETR